MEISFKDLCDSLQWDDRFYNPTKLLTMTDREYEEPEIFFAVSNRGPGKTYGFSWLLLEYFRRTGRKFALLCRTQTDLGVYANGVLSAALTDKFPKVTIKEVVSKTSKFSEIHWCNNDEDKTEEICGYVLAINAAYGLKNYANLFNDVDVMFLDEFQGDKYVSNELDKFANLHDTVARGGGKAVRYVPVILASNSITIENPYFREFGISSKIQSNTHFYRGTGLVLERFHNKYAADEREKSAFNRALKNNEMVRSSIDNTWLNDSYACICKPTEEWGGHMYMATLMDGKYKYGVRWYPNTGYYFISPSVDSGNKNIWNISVDGVENVPMIRGGVLFATLRSKFQSGQLMFSNLSVKNRIVEVIYK